MDNDQIIARLDALVHGARYAELEAMSRHILAQHRFYTWHLYLILALLRTGKRGEAARELDDLFSYKFNIAERAWPEIKAAFPEKFEQHHVLNTMRPELGIEGGARVKRRWDVPYPISDKAAFARAMDKVIADCVPPLPCLGMDTPVATFGSCFAANLAGMLKSAGVDASNLLIEESINSPLANRSFLAGLVDPAFEHAGRMRDTYGSEFLDRARERLVKARVIVLTLGVAPGFFHNGSNQLVFLEDYRVMLELGSIHMRTPTVDETKKVIVEVVALIRKLNPAARLYLSISPVALLGSMEFASPVVADCVSKTTLRAALHEVLAAERPAQAYYWPSFEIVRWLGAHASVPVFGADDSESRHVSNWVVEVIVDRFARHLFGRPETPSGGIAGRDP